jgi:hypothetical protein
VAALLGAAALAAGCQGSDEPVELAVSTPPASATEGTTTTASPAKGQPPTGSPAKGQPAPGSPATGPPPTLPASSPAADTPVAAYQDLVTGWQGARSAFFAALSDGRRRTTAQQHALAAAYLAGSRRFAAGLRVTPWPVPARAAVRELLAANAAQQATLVAMTTAPSAGAFTGRLADYGVGVARENAAVAAVWTALG